MPDKLGRPINVVIRPEDRGKVVTAWSGMTDWYSAPPDYDTFAAQYFNYTKVMLRRFGVLHVDDTAADLMFRFIERDSLSVFDPNAETKGDRAKFRSFYTRFLHTYAMGKKRNSVLLAQRQPLVFDEPVNSEEGAPTIGELLCATKVEDPAEEVECSQFLNDLRGLMRDEELPEPLLRMVDALVLLSRTRAQPPGPTALAELLGCTIPEARSALARVRKAASLLCSI